MKRFTELGWAIVLAMLIFGPCDLGAQDYDRLTIRPYYAFEQNQWLSGILEWCQSDGWPHPDPECIGLRAPESGVTRYTMTFGEELPTFKACIKVDETGQWTYENCGGGEVQLLMTDAVFLDQTSGNESCSLTRNSIVATGPDVFYLAVECAFGEHVQWAFRVPPDFTSLPVFYAWTSRSGTGEDDYEVHLRCTQGSFEAGGWEDDWTVTHDNETSGALAIIEIPLVDADMDEDDICIVDWSPLDEATTLYFAMIQ